jgi:hypothetical protein
VAFPVAQVSSYDLLYSKVAEGSRFRGSIKFESRSILSAPLVWFFVTFPPNFIAFDSEVSRECESSFSRDRIEAGYQTELLGLVD